MKDKPLLRIIWPKSQRKTIIKTRQAGTIMVCARKKHEHLDVPLGCLKCNEMGFRALSSGVDSRAATMTASGCPCSKLRAAPFMFLLTASKLALAVRLCFGARTPCCGHGLDYRRRQYRCRSGKLEQLNNQVHGRITSFRKRRRCQHTGLTPLTLHDCIINIRTNVPKYKVNSYRKCERRAA